MQFRKDEPGEKQIDLEPGIASNELKSARMQFETHYTYDFVKRFLPSATEHILEVGCGAGELAACLAKEGYGVVAIYSDRDSVAAAQRLGVDARMAMWPDFNGGQFDAVLFTRSLHHIHPLDESVGRAAESLAEGGRIIVEDFAYDSADEKTLRWFRNAIRLLEANGPDIDDGFLVKVLSRMRTLDAWQQNHEHALHTAAEIAAQLEKSFSCLIKENAAYYFRYIAGAIAPSEKRDAILQAFAEQEETLAAGGSIVPLGRRFVAMR